MSANTSAASAYLQQHQIPRILEDVIAKLVNEKPQDPFSFLAEQFRALAGSGGGGRKPRVVFVLGGPGAGKGTQCANIVRDFGWVHLSAGDLLREARNSGDETGRMIDHFIKEGQIVPVEVTVQLIRRAMEQSAQHGHTDFLIDGFPRNKNNLEGWNRVMGDYCTVEFVLFLDCPEKVMEERLLRRGQTSGRTDDNPDSIRKRFQTYVESTRPIIDHFAEQGRVREVMATAPVDVVYRDVHSIFAALGPPAASASNAKPAPSKPKVVFVLGGPGSGKGTQCENIVRDFGWVHLSAGDLLRDAQRSGDDVAKMIDQHIKEGQLVPAEIVVQLLRRAMDAHLARGHHLFLIDGFPRGAENLDCWYRVMADYCTVEFVLFFDCPEQVMEERLLRRGQTSGRADDNPESIRKRFRTYLESTLPIIDRFAKEGKVQRVPATGGVDDVYANVKHIFSTYKF